MARSRHPRSSPGLLPALLSLVLLAPVLLAPVLLAPPAVAEEAAPTPAPTQSAQPAEPAEPAEPCGACTGSLVKAWRIRHGDPKHPAPTKFLNHKGKDSKDSNLAD
ncbi:hypothetical protein SAMN06265365_10588 [Tistlia consotensis]|uniref:Uncharacterized protein n=1 Tax=Tistlia consotensis USBA 355 TaxID=560819 RepID=A0A1Y6BR77_9PROT|nr:hypothetical protein [Tistlia consotensis]SMF13909.1 hypothetical protein SAMN05428998_105210 [Tistlia consotensis USBA 355]SNR50074.1 hypothetical protein SAMN06265365_10588 [Tistlia consotensis]